jgi:hypothetical protein
MGVSGQRHAPAALYPREKGPPVPIVQEAGWAPEPVWTSLVASAPLKRRSTSTKLQGAISQKAVIFMLAAVGAKGT